MQKNSEHRRQEVQQIVKNACDQLNAEGVDARNYVEQLAWLFFLKAFDESETRREEEASFDDTPYERRLAGEYAWSGWAKDTDHPDQMLEFVSGKLWTKLTSPDPKKGLGDNLIAQRFRRIFENVRNYCRRGVSFARVVHQVDKLHFSDETDVLVLSEIYEDLLKRVAADSAGYAGEFYTQRHIIRAMVQVVQPGVKDRVYDPCFGTAGFLGEAADYLRANANLSRKQLDRLQKHTFYGLELKPLTYLLGTMNMILHGIEGANLELANTLEVHSPNVSEKDRYDVILSNPPYGGKMAQGLQNNFRVKSSATECLFVQHIMATLAKGGRAGVVIPEGVLFRGGPDQKIRKELVERFNVHTILSLPAGCFLPYTGVKTNVIFFDRPKVETKSGELATKSVWFYELTNDGFELKQTRKHIEGSQIPDFLKKWRKRTEGANSWELLAEEIVERGYDLSAKNPNSKDDYEHRPALELVQSVKAKEERIIDLLGELETILENCGVMHVNGEPVRLSDVCSIESKLIDPRESKYRDLIHVGGANIESKIGRLIELKTARTEKLKSGKFFFGDSVVLYSKIRPYLMKVARPEFAGLCSADIYPLSPDVQRLNRDYLFYLLLSRDFTRYAVSGSNRAGMPKVNRKHLFAFEFSLPTLEEQARITKGLDAAFTVVEELRSDMAYAEQNTGSLWESILRKAFAGEL